MAESSGPMEAAPEVTGLNSVQAESQQALSDDDEEGSSSSSSSSSSMEAEDALPGRVKGKLKAVLALCNEGTCPNLLWVEEADTVAPTDGSKMPRATIGRWTVEDMGTAKGSTGMQKIFSMQLLLQHGALLKWLRTSPMSRILSGNDRSLILSAIFSCLSDRPTTWSDRSPLPKCEE